MSQSNFYRDLTSFKDFRELTNTSYFSRVPEDWIVFVTDVVGSTQAIEQGRYKEVNTIGAATIACVQNRLTEIEFPYVFGGDGATLVVPSCSERDVEEELRTLKKISEEQFDLQLRVGKVPVYELIEKQSSLEVAKFEIVPGQSVAVFRGGGLSLSDELVKSKTDVYEIKKQEEGAESHANLSGLSCRWQPIDSQKGEVLSLLIEARGENPSTIYTRVLGKLEEIFGSSIEEANPVKPSGMSYKSAFSNMKDEMRYKLNQGMLKSFAWFVEIFACIWFFRLKRSFFNFEPKNYVESIRRHSDYRKFDDTLRMVIDCTIEQKSQVISFLEELYQKEEVFYGIHSSHQALMTCYVPSVKDGEHIHFIDGANGGYSTAAKQLKQQKKEQKYSDRLAS